MSGVLHGVIASLKTVTDPFWSDVSLLLNTTSTNGAQNNTFLDSSTNAFSVTRNGNTTQGTFSPFPPSAGAAWSASTNGGSGYFDGTGDYLTVADSATIRFGTGAFTIQGWVYRNAAGATHTIAAKGGASTGWVLQITSTNVLRFTDTTTNIDTTTTIPASTWTHVAVVRTGTGANGLKLYINAVDSATGTSSTDFNQADALNIGADRSNANAFNGYIASLKYTAGTAESISVPTAPATGGTVLLNFTNAGIYDSAAKNDLETVGDAQVSTTQAKWGTTSMAFDGTADRFVFPSSQQLAMGTGDFTIEGWVRRSDTNVRGIFQLCGTAGGLSGLSNLGLAIGSDTGQVWRIYANNAGYNSTATWAINTWYHFALVKTAGNIKLYVDGTSVITQADTTNYTGTFLCVGGFYDTTFLMNGYIDDLRITKGVARYTANFTPPTAAFPLN